MSIAIVVITFVNLLFFLLILLPDPSFDLIYEAHFTECLQINQPSVGWSLQFVAVPILEAFFRILLVPQGLVVPYPKLFQPYWFLASFLQLDFAPITQFFQLFLDLLHEFYFLFLLVGLKKLVFQQIGLNSVVDSDHQLFQLGLTETPHRFLTAVLVPFCTSMTRIGIPIVSSGRSLIFMS